MFILLEYQQLVPKEESELVLTIESLLHLVSIIAKLRCLEDRQLIQLWHRVLLLQGLVANQPQS